MIRLRTLGTIELEQPDGRPIISVLTQHKRLALLVYLAVAKPRGFHRRDALLGLFWPDLDANRGRDALNQSVYFLRQALGRDAILSRGREELAVNRRRLWCDVVAFEEAAYPGKEEQALKLYCGDLLHGFYLSDAVEWERWLELERSRLRAAAADAAWRIVEAASGRGEPAAAARWGRRCLALAPGDEKKLRRVIRLLDGLGDRTGALQVYEEARDWMERELDLQPAPETSAVVEEIRSPRAAAVPAGSEAAPARGSGPVSHEPHPRPLRIVSVLAAGVGLLLIGALLWPRVDLDFAAAPAEEEEEYRRGRYYLSKLDGVSYNEARRHFERALDVDPSHAPSWSGLATAFNQLASMMVYDADEAYPRARAAGERALELDPTLGEAHAALATTLAMYYWDGVAAERHFLMALKLAPESARSHRLYAAYLRGEGRFDEALEQVRIAKELDPLFAWAHVEEGTILYLAQRNAEALERYETYLDIQPEHLHVHTFVAMVRLRMGEYERALDALRTADPDEAAPDAVAIRGVVYATMGRLGEARRILEKLSSMRDARRPVSPFHLASIYTGLGERDRALDLLEEAAKRPTWQMRLLKVEPTFESLRSDPRFAALLELVGISSTD